MLSLFICPAFAAEEVFTDQAHSAVRHLPYPLRSQALVFERGWNSIYGQFDNNPLADYVGQVITQDVSNQALGVNVELQDASVLEVQEFWENAGAFLIPLNKQNNAFAQFFLGIFNYRGYGEVQTLTPKKQLRKAARFLKLASDQNYVRAIDALIDDDDLAEKAGKSLSELEENKLIATDPYKSIKKFVGNHFVSGDVNKRELARLEKVFDYFEKAQPYLKRYYYLAQSLAKNVSTHKKREVNRRLFATTTVSALGLGTLAVAQGVLNIVPPDNNTPYLKAIGGVIIGTGTLTLGATLTALPAVSNCIYSIDWQGFSRSHYWPFKKGTLLPTGFSSEEISVQSHVVTLFWGNL